MSKKLIWQSPPGLQRFILLSETKTKAEGDSLFEVTKYKRLNSHTLTKYDASSDRLYFRTLDKHTENERLHSEISELKKKLEEREKECSELRTENKQLKTEIEDLKDVSQIEKSIVQEDFFKLQSAQSQLMKENSELRNQLMNGSQFEVFAENVNRTRKEVKDLKIVLEALSKGEKVGWKIVLGIEEPNFTNTSVVDQTSKNFEFLKQDLSFIKTLVADYYAEHCGEHLCIQQ